MLYKRIKLLTVHLNNLLSGFRHLIVIFQLIRVCKKKKLCFEKSVSLSEGTQ